MSLLSWVARDPHRGRPYFPAVLNPGCHLGRVPRERGHQGTEAAGLKPCVYNAQPFCRLLLQPISRWTLSPHSLNYKCTRNLSVYRMTLLPAEPLWPGHNRYILKWGHWEATLFSVRGGHITRPALKLPSENLQASLYGVGTWERNCSCDSRQLQVVWRKPLPSLTGIPSATGKGREAFS